MAGIARCRRYFHSCCNHKFLMIGGRGSFRCSWITSGNGISIDVAIAHAATFNMVMLVCLFHENANRFDSEKVSCHSIQDGFTMQRGNPGHIFGKCSIAVVSHDGKLLIMDCPKYRLCKEIGLQYVSYLI